MNWTIRDPYRPTSWQYALFQQAAWVRFEAYQERTWICNFSYTWNCCIFMFYVRRSPPRSPRFPNGNMVLLPWTSGPWKCTVSPACQVWCKAGWATDTCLQQDSKQAVGGVWAKYVLLKYSPQQDKSNGFPHWLHFFSDWEDWVLPHCSPAPLYFKRTYQKFWFSLEQFEPPPLWVFVCLYKMLTSFLLFLKAL